MEWQIYSVPILYAGSICIGSMLLMAAAPGLTQWGSYKAGQVHCLLVYLLELNINVGTEVSFVSAD